MSINLEPPYGRRLPEDEIDLDRLRAMNRASGKPLHRDSKELVSEFDNEGGVRGFSSSDREHPLGAAMSMGLDIVIRLRDKYPIGKQIDYGGKSVMIDHYTYDHESGRMKALVETLESSQKGGEFTWIFVDEIDS